MVPRLPTEQIRTDRLVLRPLKIADLDAIACINASPEVRRFIGGPLSRDDSDRRLRDRMREMDRSGLGPRAIVSHSTGQLLGWCGIDEFEVTSEPELFYGLDRSRWGQGYATEAAVALVDMTFENSDATTIVAILEPANQASNRVLQKLGFHRDGQYLHPKRHVVHDLLRLNRVHWMYRSEADRS